MNINEALTVKELEQRLSKIKNKNLKVILFADGKFYPFLDTQSYSVNNQRVVEVAGGWGEIVFDEDGL